MTHGALVEAGALSDDSDFASLLQLESSSRRQLSPLQHPYGHIAAEYAQLCTEEKVRAKEERVETAQVGVRDLAGVREPCVRGVVQVYR